MGPPISTMYHLAKQSELIDAVEAAQARKGWGPVTAAEVMSCNPLRASVKQLARTMARVAVLPPDTLGRQLARAGRDGNGRLWTVVRTPHVSPEAKRILRA